MSSFLQGAAFTAALTIAAPVWAQVPITAEDLNRQELNRLATTTAAPVAAAPAFVADPVGLIVADGIRPAGPRFPGLLTLIGLPLAVGGSVVSTVLWGTPTVLVGGSPSGYLIYTQQ